MSIRLALRTACLPGSEGVWQLLCNNNECCRRQIYAFRMMTNGIKHMNGSTEVGKKHLNGSGGPHTNGKLRPENHITRRHDGDEFIRDAVPRLLEKALATYDARER